MAFWENQSLEELQEKLKDLEFQITDKRKQLSNLYVKLSEKALTAVSNKDFKSLITEQKDMLSTIEYVITFKKELEEIASQKIAEKEITNPDYKVIYDFVQKWKESEIAFFTKAFNDYFDNGCTAHGLNITKADEKVIKEANKKLGLTTIIKDIETDAVYRTLTLIHQLLDTVGHIIEVSLKPSPQAGFEGVVNGTKGSVRIETILAGGYNIQRLHYRTLINKI